MTRRLFVPLSVLSVVCGYISVALMAQGAPDRTKPPTLGLQPRLNLPEIQKQTLSNGLAVWLVESHEVPLVQINLLLKAGAGDDPASKFGLASLTAAMLDEGAGSRNALELADAVDFLGASLATTASFDASAVRLNVPVARMKEALPLMADVILRPTFAEAELERLRQERLTALLQAKDDPASVAPLAFARTVFGATHRYGTGTAGTETTLKGFTVQDLKSFHASKYQPGNSVLLVVGDVKVDAIVPLLETQFGSWKGTTPARAPVPQAPQVAQGQITIVDMPGAEQSQIRIGWVGVPRSTPDYFTIEVLNTILGGSFTSRLNQNLREEHQYSYGASSRFDMRLSAGAFQAGAGVQTDKTAEALKEFFNELNGILRPVPDEELNKAKNYVALSFPSEFETSGDLSSKMEEMVVYNLPDRYFADYVDNLRKVTAPAVQKVAATYIQPKRFAVVVVGDRKVIEQGIRALNLGPVRVMSVDEAVGQ
ncbi:MAG TPA: pitrilysin family protein [Vicinamibacterales bacterium]|nr:pitrilysin family protein [Vicinamibacterales bacterium]